MPLSATGLGGGQHHFSEIVVVVRFEYDFTSETFDDCGSTGSNWSNIGTVSSSCTLVLTLCQVFLSVPH